MGGGGVFPFGAPISPWSGSSPASPAGPCHPGLPPFAAVLVPVFSLSSSGALVCFVRGCFFFSPLVASPFPWHVVLSSVPPPMPPRHPLAVLAPFLVGWGSRGWGGGGAPSLSFLRRRHEARHPSLCRGGGGMPCGSRRRPFYPALAPPVVPPPGLARRVPSSGTVVWSVPHPLTAASLPCGIVLGGRVAFRPPPYPHFPPSGGRGWVGGGGAPMPSPLRCTHVAGMTQARHKHGVRHLAAAGGGGRFPFGPSRPSPWYRLRTPGSPAAVAPRR